MGDNTWIKWWLKKKIFIFFNWVIKFKLDGINYQCVGCQNETANKAKADAFVSKTKSLEFESKK